MNKGALMMFPGALRQGRKEKLPPPPAPNPLPNPFNGPLTL